MADWVFLVMAEAASRWTTVCCCASIETATRAADMFMRRLAAESDHAHGLWASINPSRLSPPIVDETATLWTAWQLNDAEPDWDPFFSVAIVGVIVQDDVLDRLAEVAGG